MPTPRHSPKAAALAKKKLAASQAKAAPKPRQRAKHELSGPAPLSLSDFQFCKLYCETSNATGAYRELYPEAKDPKKSAARLMERLEIREHIQTIFKKIARQREHAAEVAARSAMLQLEVADSRLMEVLETRRRTRGEMLTRDVKTLLVEGAVAKFDENGKIAGYDMTTDLTASLLNEGSPVEDTDLLKAIDLTYKRRGGIIKQEKKPEITVVQNMLYRPAWYQGPRTIEGQ